MRKFISKKAGEHTSFIDAVKGGNYRFGDLNKESVVQFLVFGSVYGDDTLINGIQKRYTHQPYLLKKNDGLQKADYKNSNPLIKKKPISKKNGAEKMLQFFLNRKTHLQDKKISIDLTGGADSRLIASVLHYIKLPFEALFSLSSGSEQEREIVERTADVLGTDLHIIEPAGKIKSKDDVKKLLALGDGMLDPLALHSLLKTQSWRQKNRYDIAITGVGGELYKDFWWQQDFPFYARKKSKLDKLLKLRMHPVRYKDEWFGADYSDIHKGLFSRLISQMDTYRRKWNSQTYDQIYYHLRIKEQISSLSHISSSFLPIYSPLLEPELLHIGYNLKRRDRIFKRFHRYLITRINPELAALPSTDENQTVSDKTGHMVADSLKFGWVKPKKFILRRFRTNSERTHTSNPILLYEVQKAVKKLTEAEILSDTFPKHCDELPEAMHGRLINLRYVLDYLKT